MPRPLSRAEAKSIADFYWVLSDPSRVEILDRIRVLGETHVMELVGLGTLTQGTTSYHVKHLLTHGLIERRRERGRSWLTLTAAGKEITAQFRPDGAS